MQTQQDRIRLLESLIDASSVTEVLTDIELILREKSEHIVCNYQDKALAKDWDRASNAIYTAARKVQELKL